MLQKIESFFTGHKIFVLGLLSALGITLQQFIGEPSVDYKALILAAVTAIVGYFAKSLTGTVASLTGVLGSAVITIVTAATQGGKISWSSLVLSVVVAVIGLVTGSATSTATKTS